MEEQLKHVEGKGNESVKRDDEDTQPEPQLQKNCVQKANSCSQQS